MTYCRRENAAIEWYSPKEIGTKHRVLFAEGTEFLTMDANFQIVVDGLPAQDLFFFERTVHESRVVEQLTKAGTNDNQV
jgi:hypothetical protein